MPLVPCCSQCDSTHKLIQLVPGEWFLCQDCLRAHVKGIESERDDLRKKVRNGVESQLADAKLNVECLLATSKFWKEQYLSMETQRDVLLHAGRRYVQQYALVNKRVMGVTAHMIHKAVAQVEGKEQS